MAKCIIIEMTTDGVTECLVSQNGHKMPENGLDVQDKFFILFIIIYTL